jgi:hypothetical protein
MKGGAPATPSTVSREFRLQILIYGAAQDP